MDMIPAEYRAAKSASYDELNQHGRTMPDYVVGSIIPIIVTSEAGRLVEVAKWSLVPRLTSFNAKAETIKEAYSYKDSYRSKRCLIPATAFFEPLGKKIKNIKRQQFIFRHADDSPFVLAGIWSDRYPNDKSKLTASMITCEPNTLLAPIHDRMPVMLRPEDYERWLDPRTPIEEIDKLILPREYEDLQTQGIVSLGPVEKPSKKKPMKKNRPDEGGLFG